MIGPKRIDTAVEEASKAFWIEVVKQFPEIKTDEIDNGTVIVLQLHMQEAVKRWIQTNLVEMENKK